MLYRVYKGLHAKAPVLLEKSNILIVCEQILLTLLLCCILCCLPAPQADLKRYGLVSTQNEIRLAEIFGVHFKFPIFPQMVTDIPTCFLLYSKAVAL